MSSLGIVSEATTTTVTTTSYGLPTPPVKKDRVVKRVSARAGGVKCPAKPPDCGLLHDSMSLMWGKYKDLVDELEQDIGKNEMECEELQENLNEQLDGLRSAKTRFNLQLSDSVASLNSDQEETQAKQSEYWDLEHEYTSFMKKCRSRIE